MPKENMAAFGGAFAMAGNPVLCPPGTSNSVGKTLGTEELQELIAKDLLKQAGSRGQSRTKVALDV